MKIQPITLQMIAEKAGVHRTSVSMALRNHPSLPLKTRQRIQALAKKMGYRPNPLLSVYQSTVRARKKTTYQATIAWIDDSPNPSRWQNLPWLEGYWDGATQRAEELGYRLDLIHRETPSDANPEKSAQQFQKNMGARGIHGAVLPHLYHQPHAAFDWPQSAIAVIGGTRRMLPGRDVKYYRKILPWYSVNPDHAFNTKLALHELLKSGHRRIGLILTHWQDRQTDELIRGSLLAFHEQIPFKDRIPPLLVDKIQAKPCSTAQDWLREFRPDVLLGDHRDLLSWPPATTARKFRVALLNLSEDLNGICGIRQQHAQLGAAAIDLVDAQLLRNQRGIPEYARELLIRGIWENG